MPVQIYSIPAIGQQSIFYGVPNTPVFGINAIIRIKNESPTKYKNVHEANLKFKCRAGTMISQQYFYTTQRFTKRVKIVDGRWGLVAPPAGEGSPNAGTRATATGSSTIPPIPPKQRHRDNPLPPTHRNIHSPRYDRVYTVKAEAIIPRKHLGPQSISKKLKPTLTSAIYPAIQPPQPAGWQSSIPYNLPEMPVPRLNKTEPADCPFLLDFTLPAGTTLQHSVPFTITFRITPTENTDISTLKSIKIRLKQYLTLTASEDVILTKSLPLLSTEFTPQTAQGGGFMDMQVWNLDLSPKTKKEFKETMRVEGLMEVSHRLKVDLGVVGRKKGWKFQTLVRVVRSPEESGGGVWMS
ncbi:hypothetical protein HDV00_000590 [Rhizophlyctis rosea]|nr:hypothetical protein HDV00_000590 [Rhizophlyctis rosea]